MSPTFSYVQLLINANKAFTVHLSTGDQLQVLAGNASFSAANALLLQVNAHVQILEESAITYIEHDGNPLS